jgi:hypothetical protein
MSLLIYATNYKNHWWQIYENLKVTGLLLGLKTGNKKYCCLCLCQSRATVKQCEGLTRYRPPFLSGNIRLSPERVLLSPQHIRGKIGVNEKLSEHHGQKWWFPLLTSLLHGAVILKKLTGFRLVMKLHPFYWTTRFNTAFTCARHLSISSARSFESVPHVPLTQDPS